MDVKVTLDGCLTCGGPLEEVRVDLRLYDRTPPEAASEGDPVPDVGVPVYGVWHPGCQSPPGGASDGGGACVALWHGVPVRKVPAVLRLLSRVRLTQGTLTQDALRHAAGAMGIAYT